MCGGLFRSLFVGKKTNASKAHQSTSHTQRRATKQINRVDFEGSSRTTFRASDFSSSAPSYPSSLSLSLSSRLSTSTSTTPKNAPPPYAAQPQARSKAYQSASTAGHHQRAATYPTQRPTSTMRPQYATNRRQGVAPPKTSRLYKQAFPRG